MDKHLHHIEHLILYSALLWQIGLIMYLLVKRLVKFIPKTKIIHTSHEKMPLTTTSSQRNLKAIEVGVKKNIIVEKADSSSIATDEIIKGKVKTQKDKLKRLK